MDVNELMAYKPSKTPKRPAPQDPVDQPVEEVQEDDPNDSYEVLITNGERDRLFPGRGRPYIII